MVAFVHSTATVTSSTVPIGKYIYINASAGTATTSLTSVGGGSSIGVIRQPVHLGKDVHLSLGQEFDVVLPDKSRLKLKKDGSYTLEDKDAAITYKANNIRSFNRYVNASDLLEEFMRYVGDVVKGINVQGIIAIPIELFIKWLIIRAAEEDKEDISIEDKSLLTQSISRVALTSVKKPRKRSIGPTLCRDALRPVRLSSSFQ